MLNDKDIRILSYLYEKKTSVSITELSEAYNLGSRSIRNYIDRINDNFSFQCIKLSKGYYEITNYNAVEEFLNTHNINSYSSDLVVKYMIHVIGFFEKINLTHIMEKFDISRTTVKNYKSLTSEYLVRYHLKLEQTDKYGLTLVGEEKNKRRLVLNLLLKFKKLHPIEMGLISPVLKNYSIELYERTLPMIIKKLSKELEISFSNQAYEIIFNYLLIMINRCNSNYLEKVESRIFLKNSKEYKIVNTVLQNFSLALGIKLKENEVMEITNIILGLNYTDNIDSKNDNWFEYELFISKLIWKFSEYYGFNFSKDYELYEGLLNHIKPAMYRMTNKINLTSIDYDYIVSNAQNEYAIVKQVLNDFDFFPKNKYMPEYDVELSLITLHFKLAVDRNVQRSSYLKKVLIVSSLGYGGYKFLRNKISELYEIDKIEIIPLYQLKDYDLNNWDLVITTINDLEISIPLVEITPTLSQEDYDKISKFLKKKVGRKIKTIDFLKKMGNLIPAESQDELEEILLREYSDFFEKVDGDNKFNLEKILPISNIILDIHGEDIEEIIEMAGDLLLSNEAILPSYKEKMKSVFVENGSHMMIGENIVIPHTKNENNVFKTNFTFIRLKSPIKFKNKEISLVIAFCAKEEDEYIPLLLSLTNIIQNKEIAKEFYSLKDKKEILEYLKEFSFY